MSCSALVSPASPITNARPFGRWLSRKRAVASAEVHSASGGIESPLSASREARSLGEKRELFVRTRKLKPALSRAARKRSAPGTAAPPFTSTPSMSHSQFTAGWRVLMSPVCRVTDQRVQLVEPGSWTASAPTVIAGRQVTVGLPRHPEITPERTKHHPPTHPEGAAGTGPSARQSCWSMRTTQVPGPPAVIETGFGPESLPGSVTQPCMAVASASTSSNSVVPPPIGEPIL